MSNYKPVKGDRVRVVLEGEVLSAARNYFELSDKTPERDQWCNTYVLPESDYFVSVEKIEPPVEVFGPGDVVRSIQYPKHVYSLGNGGYYSHFMEKTYRPLGAFTADEYELVYRP